MNLKWTEFAPIATGGAIFDSALSDGRHWLATRAGLFMRDADGWHMVERGLRFAQTQCVAASGDTVLVAGQPQGLMRSEDGGKSWRRCRIEQTNDPIVSLVLSPNFERDDVVLAGTLESGVLRSTNGGRHFELVNYGIGDLGIVDLAVASNWTKQAEPAFALTETKLYRSPNGGRGWREADLSDWRPTAAVEVDESSLAARRFLWFQPHGTQWLAGGPDDGLWVADAVDGEWRSIWQQGSVLALEAAGSQIFVSHENGVSVSADSGQSWQAVDFGDATPSVFATVGDSIWAASPAGAFWKLSGADREVREGNGVSAELLSLHGIGDSLLATYWLADARMIHIWRRDAAGDWQRIFAEQAARIIPVLATIKGDHYVAIGKHLYRADGTTWQKFEAPDAMSALVEHQQAMLVVLFDQVCVFADDVFTPLALPSVSAPLAAAFSAEEQLILFTRNGIPLIGV